MVIGHGAERFVTKRYVRMKLIRRLGVKVDCGHEGLVHAAEAVNGDLFDQEFFRGRALFGGDLVFVRVHRDSFALPYSGVFSTRLATLWEHTQMKTRVPVPPPRNEALLPVGTTLALDTSVHVVGSSVVTGGHPWRLLRLNQPALATIDGWRRGEAVTAHSANLARTLVDYGMAIPHGGHGLKADDVDVIIPVYGSANLLDRLLTDLTGLHVTVVDDCSPEPTAIQAVVSRHGAHYLSSPTNEGPGAARNRGVGATTRPFVLFVDVDVRVADATHLLDALGRSFVDARVAVVAPRIVGTSSSTTLGSYEARFGALDRGVRSGLVVPQGSIGFVPSAALLVRRDALGDGFDPSLRSGEDVDLVWRLVDAGWLVRYDANVQVQHDARSDFGAWWRQRASYGASAYELAKRHPTHYAPLRLQLLTLGVWIAVWRRRLGLFAVLSAYSVLVVRRRLPSDLTERDRVALGVVARGVATSLTPTARALTRSYFPVVLVGLCAKRTRRAALVLAGLSWITRAVDDEAPSLQDLALLAGDDAAYASGLWRTALSRGDLSALRPRVTFPSRQRREGGA